MTADLLIFLAVAVGVALILRELTKVNRRLEAVQKVISDQATVTAFVHDVAHPVFSLQQLHRVREGFESAFQEKARRESELHQSEEWVGMKMPVAPSPKIMERMKALCEAVAKAESAWREYQWMVEANVAVANGQESRADALRRFGERTKDAPGASDRARKLMSSWIARMTGESEEDLEIDLPGHGVTLREFQRTP